LKTKGDNGDKRELFIFCSKKYFEQKIKDIDNVTQTEKKDDSDCKELIIWERYGSYHWLQYSKRTFDVNDFIPRPEQSKVIDEILELYNKNKYCVILLHGKKGCGKSMIPLLLGKKITKKDQEVHFCDTFKPTDPGDQFSSLYNLIE
jgi:DNA replication protein DnaC